MQVTPELLNFFKLVGLGQPSLTRALLWQAYILHLRVTRLSLQKTALHGCTDLAPASLQLPCSLHSMAEKSSKRVYEIFSSDCF